MTYNPQQVNPIELVNTVKQLGYQAVTEKVLLPVLGMSCAS